jgi:hypothetical protein
MSTRIEDFLIELSKNPYRAIQFTENPEAESGLTAEELKILAPGNRNELDRTLHMAKAKNEGKKAKPKTKKK